MTLFADFPTYSPYRNLRLTTPMTVGEDVYALQTALQAAGYSVGNFDGVLGKITSAAIGYFQTDDKIKSDKVAGPQTQAELALIIAGQGTSKYSLPLGLLKGQLTHESGLHLGNYSPLRKDNSYDAGVAQRNTAHTPAAVGFNVPKSVEALALDLRAHYDKFAGVPGRRRWELASGAWNAPAYASFIAREEGAKGVLKSETAEPSAAARATLEAYIESTTALMA